MKKLHLFIWLCCVFFVVMMVAGVITSNPWYIVTGFIGVCIFIFNLLIWGK